MKQGFFYIIKDEFFDKFTDMGCKFKYNKNASRPTYCCFEDIKHKGLFWAIPTGSIDNKNLNRINTYIAYYHAGEDLNHKGLKHASS